jgi:hypothetical protein
MASLVGLEASAHRAQTAGLAHLVLSSLRNIFCHWRACHTVCYSFRFDQHFLRGRYVERIRRVGWRLVSMVGLATSAHSTPSVGLVHLVLPETCWAHYVFLHSIAN